MKDEDFREMTDTTKFDTSIKPFKPNRGLMLVEWAASYPMLMAGRAKLKKINCEGLKPPYILLSTHASMIDFAMAVRANFPYRSNWLITIEIMCGLDWLMRRVGGIYKRKFTTDVTVVRHILTALKENKNVCTIYPEARFSLAGVNEQLDEGLGLLVKAAKCPVVVLNMNGNFLRSPQWNKHPYRNVPVRATMTQIVTKEEAMTLSSSEIQKRIEDAFVYDDYKWQFDNKIKITSKKRAHNIHKILYQCPHCLDEFSMKSQDTKLWCEKCGKKWEMDVYGQLHCENGDDVFNHVPDWYRWERENVKKEVESGNYRFEDTAWLEQLHSKGEKYRRLGQVKLVHDENGFSLSGTIDGKEFELKRPVHSMYSCHIEYNFKEKGDAIDLCTLEDTYFVFPQNYDNIVTKIHFATEELFKKDQTARRLAEKPRRRRVVKKTEETVEV